MHFNNEEYILVEIEVNYCTCSIAIVSSVHVCLLAMSTSYVGFHGHHLATCN